MNKFRGLADLGPAIVVAVVAFGPGSILIATQVGATFGPWSSLVVLGATLLMIGAASLAMRVGALLKDTPCGELRQRLGPWASVGIGLVVFGTVAIFQSSNNAAIIAGLEALVPTAVVSAPAEEANEAAEREADREMPSNAAAAKPKASGPLDSLYVKWAILITANAVVLVCLYVTHSLYSRVERLMKALMFAMVVAFSVNFVVALVFAGRPIEPTANVAQATAQVEIPKADALAPPKWNWIPLLGLIGTTFSVAGAYYQAYLVRERNWGPDDLSRGLFDAIAGGLALGVVTALMVFTGALAFYGRLAPAELDKMQVVDIAKALEPLFGDGARVVFGIGLLAATFCSFLVNAMAGGTILADSLGWGSRISERGPKALSAAALLIGMVVAMAAFAGSSTTGLIFVAQALTVIGLPALASALLYLGFQRRPDGAGIVTTPWMACLGALGLILSCVLAGKLAYDVIGKLFPAA